MSVCDRIRPWLSLAAEGEVDPEQALLIGRHVQDCTGCRIRLARERRLARIVDGLDDPIEVDASFLRRVMDELPERPAPRSPRKRRGLKLAGLAILFGLAGSSTLGAIAIGRSWSLTAERSVAPLPDGGASVVSVIGDVLANFGALAASVFLDGAPALQLDAPFVAGGVVVGIATVIVCMLAVASMLLLAGARYAWTAAGRAGRH